MEATKFFLTSVIIIQCHFSAVVYILYSVKNSPNSPIAVVSFPDGKKASSVACCFFSVAALCLNGRVYTSPIEKGSSVFKFSIVAELLTQEIDCVSGILVHYLAVSKDGGIFGPKEYGQIGIGERTESVSSFTEISLHA